MSLHCGLSTSYWPSGVLSDRHATAWFASQGSGGRHEEHIDFVFTAYPERAAAFLARFKNKLKLIIEITNADRITDVSADLVRDRTVSINCDWGSEPRVREFMRLLETYAPTSAWFACPYGLWSLKNGSWSLNRFNPSSTKFLLLYRKACLENNEEMRRFLDNHVPEPS